MLQGKLPPAGAAAPLDLADRGKAGLRPVVWSDLVARFDAVRELRAELGVGEVIGDASFDPDSARHIAELSDGKSAINFDDLADGKAVVDNSRREKNGAASDHPRTR
jgi:hypothetical protein